MGIDAPHRPPSAKPDNGWRQSGDTGSRGNSPYPAKGKKGHKGKGKEKGKGKGKEGKGKGKSKRKGAHSGWGEGGWYEYDESWEDSNYQLQADGVAWVAKDWENGWLGSDGVTWINPNQASNTVVGQGQLQPQ